VHAAMPEIPQIVSLTIQADRCYNAIVYTQKYTVTDTNMEYDGMTSRSFILWEFIPVV